MRRGALAGALGALLLAAPAQGQGVPGRWEFSQFDPAGQTNSSESALWLEAEGRLLNPQPSDPHAVRVLPVLSIQCRNGEPDFFIRLNFEAPPGPVAVNTSLDGGDPVAATWQLRDKATALAPDDKLAFVRAMLGKRWLDLTLTFAEAEPTSTRFEIAGIDAALEKLKPACPW